MDIDVTECIESSGFSEERYSTSLSNPSRFQQTKNACSKLLKQCNTLYTFIIENYQALLASTQGYTCMKKKFTPEEIGEIIILTTAVQQGLLNEGRESKLLHIESQWILTFE